MEKYYLFGAGKNCYSVIHFLNKENIIAVIDNREDKRGREIDGIKIINFSDLLKDYAGELVIISAYIAREEVKKQLCENGVTNFIVAPYMYKGYYTSFEEMISRLHIDEMEELYIWGENFFSQKFYEALQETNIGSIVRGFVRDDVYGENEFLNIPVIERDEVPEGANVLLAVELDEDEKKSLSSKYHLMDIYQGTTKEHPELLKFKNLHAGKRCFVIGNGPSLKISDLEILKKNNEICFASNFIIKVFDDTDWRPDYYVILDYDFFRIMPDNLQKNGENIIRFIADTSLDMNPENKDYVYTYQSIYDGEKITFSADLVTGIYTAKTVTYDMLQIAAFMGFKEIYLIGVDGFDMAEKVFTHFYETNQRKDEVIASMYPVWLEGYRKADEYSRANGFRIFNATRGGYVEIFDRVDFDSLF